MFALYIAIALAPLPKYSDGMYRKKKLSASGRQCIFIVNLQREFSWFEVFSWQAVFCVRDIESFCIIPCHVLLLLFCLKSEAWEMLSHGSNNNKLLQYWRRFPFRCVGAIFSLHHYVTILLLYAPFVQTIIDWEIHVKKISELHRLRRELTF